MRKGVARGVSIKAPRKPTAQAVAAPYCVNMVQRRISYGVQARARTAAMPWGIVMAIEHRQCCVPFGSNCQQWPPVTHMPRTTLPSAVRTTAERGAGGVAGADGERLAGAVDCRACTVQDGHCVYVGANVGHYGHN